MTFDGLSSCGIEKDIGWPTVTEGFSSLGNDLTLDISTGLSSCGIVNETGTSTCATCTSSVGASCSISTSKPRIDVPASLTAVHLYVPLSSGLGCLITSV